MHRRWLEALNFRFKKKRKSTIGVAKTMALISLAVTEKLICIFVFAYADCWFAHEEAQVMKEMFIKYSNLPVAGLPRIGCG